MQITDKVYLKKQYIDPNGSFIPPGIYQYGELHYLIRDNTEFVSPLQNLSLKTVVIKTEEPIEYLNVSKQKQEEIFKPQFIKTEINNVEVDSKFTTILEKSEEEKETEFVPKKIREYKKKNDTNQSNQQSGINKTLSI